MPNDNCMGSPSSCSITSSAPVVSPSGPSTPRSVSPHVRRQWSGKPLMQNSYKWKWLLSVTGKRSDQCHAADQRHELASAHTPSGQVDVYTIISDSAP